MTESAHKPRVLSLDVMRGITIGAMIVVNNPGSWSHVYGPLRHAEWHGWTPTDLIFPFFLFIVGVAVPFSLRRYLEGERATGRVYARIARRVAVLVLLGLLLSALPWRGFETLRLPGVLQRIALVYLFVSLLVLHTRVWLQGVVAVVVLVGYWVLLTRVPGPDGSWGLGAESNIVRALNRAVLGEGHLYRHSPTDPEGLLSTLPACVTALLGFWCGLALRNVGEYRVRASARIALAGVVALIAGWVWSLAGFPINKPLWTSSYVLFTGGWAMILLALLYWVIDVHGWRVGVRPFAVLGVNAIFVFVASGLVGRLLISTRIGDMTTKQWVYEYLFATWLSPVNASLAFALVTLGLWWLVLIAMDRRGWHLRV